MHDAGAASACSSCTPGATATTSDRRALGAQGPDQPLHAARARRGGSRPVIEAFASAPRWRSAGYDGVEVMGSEGYLITQFLRAAHQPAQRRLGRAAREPHALRGGDRAPHARGRGAGLHHHLPAVHAGPGGRRARPWDEIGAGEGHRAAGATSSTPASAGTRRASRPSRTSVPRAAFAWVTAQAQGRGRIPVIATNRINTPEVAEGILAAGQADMVSMARPLARRPRVGQQGRERPRRHQHLHRLQPGLPRPRLREQARHLPGQPAGCPRPSSLPARPRRQAHRGGRRRAGRLACATVAAERGHG